MRSLLLFKSSGSDWLMKHHGLLLPLQVTWWHCSSSVIYLKPSGRWTSAAGILCTWQQSSLWSWSWRWCCMVGKTFRVWLHTRRVSPASA